jgi:hypothetical protein
MLALLVEWILNGSAHGSRLSVASTNLMDLEHLAGLRYSYTSCNLFIVRVSGLMVEALFVPSSVVFELLTLSRR